MESKTILKDANKVINILSGQNADLNKTNAFLSAIIQEKDEEIIELKKAIEEINKKK